MGWLRERVWQLGSAIVLVFVGAALTYLDATAEGLGPLGLVGYALFVVGLAIPLVSRAVEAAQDLLGEDV